jgi:phosphate transport system substrate-binding protein
MLPEEIKQLAEKQGSLGISILCARDAISIYLHPGNPVRTLSLTQVRNIFLGSIQKWSEVGGRDAFITVLSRNPNSGTYLFVEQRVLMGNPYTGSAVILPTTGAIIDSVASDVNAIGYGGMAYGENVYHCRIDTIAPTPANVRNGTYPISRHLYLYTVLRPKGLLKEFTDWVLSEEGQRIVEKVGYIPLYDLE